MKNLVQTVIFKLNKSTSNRVFRRYMRVFFRSVLIAVLVWFLIIIYAFIFKFEKLLKSNIRQIFNASVPDPVDSLGNIYQDLIIDESRTGSNGLTNDLNQLRKLNEFELAKVLDVKSLEFLKQVQRRPYDVNCRRLIEWDEDEVRKAKRILFKLNSNLNNRLVTPNVSTELNVLFSIPLLNDENFIFPDSKCRLFRELRGYDKYKVSEFEQNFPIAYSILTYNNVEQFERLLKAIYRPQNAYCIHIDSKSQKRVHNAIHSLAACFPNVFVSTRLEHIVYAGFSRLRADLNCMSDLTWPNFTHPNLAGKKFSVNWKYILNLASSEFPLRTNYELARILHMFNGANDIEVMTKFQKERIQFSWKVTKRENSNSEHMVRTKRFKSNVPHNYTIVKGITYCSFSRKFVEYVLTNEYAKDLLKWSEDTYSPDEWYWATINYNVQFNPPGGFKDSSRVAIPTKTRYIGWRNSYKCMGELRHGICVFSVEDLPELVTRNEFFLNKFLLEYDPIAYECMEEWLINRASAYHVVNIIDYCRLLFVIPYSINPSCARIVENRNYKQPKSNENNFSHINYPKI